ncbi:MAG: NAD(P)-dependent glycerol-3-phosphate dehydrogenase [Candidatus Eisenbacteria bacterium]|uniref:Glycerol-3-phosphate dehydrogenase [NAD(P)+] n=1 Tax=Eiseniibacteriota bacterium TaxID=2212470 RepID=A0A937X9K9_UNCEI|nr:NAD(P)-dependent glycerol-3-phosphate dehydrogenase [Candidatus Eisenbacteria bacterium]
MSAGAGERPGASPGAAPAGGRPGDSGTAARSRVAVLGAGSWGTTLALHLSRRGASVALWEFDAARARRLSLTRESLPFLPGHRLPDSITATSDLAEALGGAEVAVIAVPSSALASLAARVVAAPQAPPLWVSATKGIDEETGLTPRPLFSRLAGIPEERIVVLAGPSFALEVAAGKPTAILAAGSDEPACVEAQRLFSGDTLRVYTSPDPLGVEIGVSLKNVIAIAAGVAAGLDLGSNGLGALITRGLAEITRLGVRLGARPETFLGLAGIGDLVITSTSTLSRNYRVGFALARGEQLEQILNEIGMVAEGVRTCRSAIRLAERLGVDLPIARQVHAVLYEGLDPRRAVLELMSRPLRAEF